MNKAGVAGTIVAVTAVVGLSAVMLRAEFLEKLTRDAPAATAKLGREIDDLAAGEGGEVVGALKRLFPDEYAAFKTQVIANVQAGFTPDQVRIASRDLSSAFIQRSLGHIASAPDSQLVTLGKATTDFLAVLQPVSAQECANFAVAGAAPARALSGDALKRLNALAVAKIEAVRAGTDAPQRRSAPTDADYQLLVETMLDQGASTALVRSLETIESQPSAVQCDAGLALLKATVALPPAASARLVAQTILPANSQAAPQTPSSSATTP